MERRHPDHVDKLSAVALTGLDDEVARGEGPAFPLRKDPRRGEVDSRLAECSLVRRLARRQHIGVATRCPFATRYVRVGDLPRAGTGARGTGLFAIGVDPFVCAVGDDVFSAGVVVEGDHEVAAVTRQASVERLEHGDLTRGVVRARPVLVEHDVVLVVVARSSWGPLGNANDLPGNRASADVRLVIRVLHTGVVRPRITVDGGRAGEPGCVVAATAKYTRSHVRVGGTGSSDDACRLNAYKAGLGGRGIGTRQSRVDREGAAGPGTCERQEVVPVDLRRRGRGVVVRHLVTINLECGVKRRCLKSR